MGKDRLDKVVKDKLYDLHTPIDTNELWSGIQTKMESDNTPTSGFPFMRFIGFGTVALLLVGSYFFMQSNMTDEIQGKDYSEVSIEDKRQDAYANENEIKKAKEFITSENAGSNSSSKNQKQKVSSATSKTTNNNNAVRNNENLNAPQKISSTKKSITNNKKLRPNKKATNSTASSMGATSNFNTPSNFNSSSDSTIKNSLNINGLNKARLNSVNSASDNTSLLNSMPSKITNGNSRKGSSNDGGNSNIFDGSVTTKNNNHFGLAGKESKIENTFMNPISSLENKFSLQYDDQQNFTACERLSGDACNSDAPSLRNRVECYDNWTAERSKLSILPYVGLDFVTNDGSRTEGASNEYLGVRESTMEFLEVLKAGLLIKYNLTPNVYFKAGIEYDQIREKFESTLIETSEILDPNAIIAYQIDMEGDTIPVYGPGTTTIISTTEWRKYNKYHSFNVPIVLGYEAPLSKRWDFFGEAGVFYNVRFNYVGKLLDPNNDVVSGENFFRNQTGVSLYGGAGTRFNVNKRWSLVGTGSYKYNLASINNATFNPIKQNLGLAGFAIGAEIRL